MVKLISVFRFSLIIPILLLAVPAYGAGAGAGAVHADVLQMVDHLFGGLDVSAFKMAKALLSYTFGSGSTPSPTSLFAAVALLMFTVYGYQMAIGSNHMNPLGGVIRFLMMLLIVSVTLGHYREFMTIFFGGFNKLAALLLNSVSVAKLPDASDGSLFGGGIEQFFTLIITMAHNFPVFSGHSSHWWQVGKEVNKLVMQLMQIIFYLIPLAAILIATVAYAGMVVFAMVYQALGIVFGPIMLILLLIPPFEGMAYGWLKYCFSAGFLKLVLAALIGLMSAFLQYGIEYTHAAIGTVSTGQGAGGAISRAHFLAVDILGLSVITVIAGVFILALLAAPMLANNLLGGGVGALGNFSFGKTHSSGNNNGGGDDPPPPEDSRDSSGGDDGASRSRAETEGQELPSSGNADEGGSASRPQVETQGGE